MVNLLRRLLARKRHYPLHIAGNYTQTCKCGYHNPWDYNLHKHLEQEGPARNG